MIFENYPKISNLSKPNDENALIILRSYKLKARNEAYCRFLKAVEILNLDDKKFNSYEYVGVQEKNEQLYLILPLFKLSGFQPNITFDQVSLKNK